MSRGRKKSTIRCMVTNNGPLSKISLSFSLLNKY